MEKLDRILHDLDQGNTNVTDAKKLVLDLFLVSCCYRVQKKFADGTNYLSSKGYFSKHKSFAESFTKTEAERIARYNEAEIEIYNS